MTVIYSNALKDTRMTAVVTACDAGPGPATMEICSATYASVLVILTLLKPSFTEAAQTITVSGVPITGTAAASGTAAIARIKDSAGNVVVQGLTVGTTAADVIVNTTTINTGDPLILTSGTITHG
jgi:hypothetical protein